MGTLGLMQQLVPRNCAPAVEFGPREQNERSRIVTLSCRVRAQPEPARNRCCTVAHGGSPKSPSAQSPKQSAFPTVAGLEGWTRPVLVLLVYQCLTRRAKLRRD